MQSVRVQESDFFYFKAFKVYNPSTVFRINTDGVLLAAWCDPSESSKILDLGAGTGVIAFILCNRHPDLIVHAIDNNQDAIEAIRKTQKLNEGFDGISSECISFYDFDLDHHKFDHIVSNPPFFHKGTLPDSAIEQNAKHNFSFSGFWTKISETQNKPSYISMILPYVAAQQFIEIGEARAYNLIRSRKVIKENGEPLRLLFTLSLNSHNQEIISEDDLIIQTGGNRNYTEDYKELTRDLYLNF